MFENLGEAGKQEILQQMFRKFQISNRLPNRCFSENCRWVPLYPVLNAQSRSTRNVSLTIQLVIFSAATKQYSCFHCMRDGKVQQVTIFHCDCMPACLVNRNAKCDCQILYRQILNKYVNFYYSCRVLLIVSKEFLISLPDHFTFLGNCPPTPPLSQHFARSEKKVLILAQGRGRWAVTQKRMMSLPSFRRNGKWLG